MPPKKQQQKMSLGDFLQDETLGSWADEMEDLPTVPSTGSTGYGKRDYGDSGRMGGDRDYAPRQQLPIPDKPPYTAHIGNLSFETTEADVREFFADCDVTSVRLVHDRIQDRPKGFGYIEFKTVEGLTKALDRSGTPFFGRDIRVSVAEADRAKDRGEEARTITEWRRTGPLPPLESSHPRRDRPERFHGSDAGDRPERSERRPSGFNDEGRTRNFDNWERKGPLPAPVTPVADRPQSREGLRRGSPSHQEGGAPPRRGFGDKPPVERQLTAAERDNEWRRGARPDPPARSTPVSPSIPQSRPKLELKKRSENAGDVASPSAPSDSKSSPFGAARPVDTTSKLLEIEAKLAQERKEKEERLRKEREEKAAAAAAEGGAKSPQGPRRDRRGGDTPTTPRNFDTLRRGSALTNADGDEGITKSSATSQAGDQPPAQEPAAEAAPAQPEGAAPAQAVEDDGWSTVPQKKGRRGQNGRVNA